MATITPTSLHTSDKNLAKAWLLLNKRIMNALATASQDAGLSNYVYVDGVNGNDATAVRGSLLNPFLTIQAALDAAQAGDTVLINPGTYSENLVMPATNNLVIQGSGKQNTIIDGQASFAFVCQADIQALEIRDLSMVNNAATGTLIVNYNGTVIAGAFLTGELRLVNLFVANSGAGDSYELGSLNNFWVESCTGGGIVAHEVSKGSITGCDLISLDYEYDPNNETPLPLQGVDEVVVLASEFPSGILHGSGTTDENVGQLVVGPDVIAGGGITARVTDDALYADGGKLTFRGTCIGNATLDANYGVAGPTHYAFDLDGSKVTGALAVQNINGGGTPQATTASAKNAQLEGPVTSGSNTALDIRNSSFVQANLAVLINGTIDRSIHIETVPPGGGGVVFAVPFSTANYNAHYEISVVGDAPVISGPGGKTPTGIVVIPAAANAPVEMTIVMNNP